MKIYCQERNIYYLIIFKSMYYHGFKFTQLLTTFFVQFFVLLWISTT